MANTLRVMYTGTNVGKIYFTDVDKRHQLGGSAEGSYIGGQDEYIMWGETKVLQLTDDVLYSVAKGILKYFSTASSSTVFSTHNGAPLELLEGSYTSADEVPRQDIGDTGGTRFTDAYMAILANDKYSTGLGPVSVVGGGYTGGETGYYFGNA
jgi:hypothetical protein